jgi:hypothetical protein
VLSELRDILPSLMGWWVLSRSIDNGGSMVGSAAISRRDDGRYDYREAGRLTLADGQTMEAERRYIFATEADGFAVFFAETPPLLFHRVVLERTGPTLVANGIHLCGADHYDTSYEFRADGSFTIRHVVTGPRKRYAMETRYTRDGKREG